MVGLAVWLLAGAATAQDAQRCPSGMALIAEGAFAMGSLAGDGDPDEAPERRVWSAAFCMDDTEVTVGAYRACVRSGRCSAPVVANETPVEARLCNWRRTDVERHPVNCVDWNQAETYCASVGARLPTEAEWEFAARGTAGRRFPWGDEAADATRANLCGAECSRFVGALPGAVGWTPIGNWNDPWALTAPVGSFPEGATPEGLHDMAGNVWEWTQDGYETSDGGRREEGVTAQRPAAWWSDNRVYRGGGWDSMDVSWARSANRAIYGRTARHHSVGFRCVRGAPLERPRRPRPLTPRERSLMET